MELPVISAENGQKIDFLQDLSLFFEDNIQHAHWTRRGLDGNANCTKPGVHGFAVSFKEQWIVFQLGGPINFASSERVPNGALQWA